MLLDWIKNDPRGEAYRDLDWSKEYDLARNGDPNDTQTALLLEISVKVTSCL